ncbi:hypothetical protein [Alloalcanivorax xenomutans]|uniref:antitoxin PaaA2 family protein n=1 Tax=Alloalcanivorax xenomutans TaxID=1094342 RepID=UPI003A802B18
MIHPDDNTTSAERDTWFRVKVQEALDDPRPAIPHDQVEAHFAKRRADALRPDRSGNSGDNAAKSDHSNQ